MINKPLKKSASKTSKMTRYRIPSYRNASLIVRIRTQKACKKKVMEANQTKRKIMIIKQLKKYTSNMDKMTMYRIALYSRATS